MNLKDQFTNLLQNKKILLGVTGSISVYKALELTRLFIKAGAEVKVVMSQSAKKFVTPLSFEVLTSNRVLDDTNECWVSDHNHIKTTSWADVFVIAPATANTIAKLANAIADNMLLQCALAFENSKIIAPAANTKMLANPITQANIKMLNISSYTFVETQNKELACKEVGDGALAEPLDIFYTTARELLKDEYWVNRRVVVSGGGTIEKIDEVRYLSNFSSGKMANNLALSLYLRGADVNLISTKLSPELPTNMHHIEVQSSEEMQEYIKDSIRIAKKGILTKATLVGDSHPELIRKEPYLFMVAAVSDYIPKFSQSGKLKKETLGNEWSLELKQNIDILNSLDKTDIKTIAFKAEMDISTAKMDATNILEKKKVDAVCLNILEDSSSFGTTQNSIELITKNSSTKFEKMDKLPLSLKIVDSLKGTYSE
ncbi:MAG: bifunctional phosphopantothenoylcysteine decarboxylase/phosphopantothenate--cysteine ligase CoaBC [Helicobacteraceae bacterium]|nr:bifunctional phosphopantothenoylcysteine decarboxylase/phosphopantothenate--cysteine ligase CoaBC [Helicobacteraceae bacterium]